MAFSPEHDQNQPALSELPEDSNEAQHPLPVKRRLVIGSTRFGAGVAIAEVISDTPLGAESGLDTPTDNS